MHVCGFQTIDINELFWLKLTETAANMLSFELLISVTGHSYMD